ncbi:Oligosaccharide 4-alpha-D-glucosyltransferase [Halotydeus destructor]|nr:Oligosaccharide 4-alpha-D-glucosyltransferase [Halotydeus destructor]
MAAKYVAGVSVSESVDDIVYIESSDAEQIPNVLVLVKDGPHAKAIAFQVDQSDSTDSDQDSNQVKTSMLATSKSSDHLVNVQEMKELSEPEAPEQVQEALTSRKGSKVLTDKKVTKGRVLSLSLDDSTGNWSVHASKKGNRFKHKLGLSSLDFVLRRRNEPDFCMKAVVLLMFVTIVSTITAVTIIYKKEQVLSSMDAQIFFWDANREFDLLSADGSLILKTHYGSSLPRDLSPNRCLSIDKDGQLNDVCRNWKHRAHLDINFISRDDDKISCYHVHWQGHTEKTVLKDCFDLGTDHWYGMGHVWDTPWPLGGFSMSMHPFVTGHSKPHPLGSIIKRYWISSSGIAIRVPLNVPLYVSFNSTENNENGDGQLCFQSAVSRYPYDAVEGILPHLDYTICSGSDMKTVHREMSKAWVKKTSEHDVAGDIVIQSAFLSQPIWATDMHSLEVMNQESVSDYANSTIEYGMEPGFILLDSRWEDRIGDLEVNSYSFPSVSNMFSVLRNQGYKVLLTVSPFMDIGAKGLPEASRDARIISDPHLKVPLLTQCFGEGPYRMCALLDMMNATTREWFRNSMTKKVLEPFKIDGFVFKGAQVSLMPHHIHSFQHNIINPDYFQMYYKNVARHMSHFVGMNTAVGVQKLDGFYQILPLSSTWSSLGAIIPTVMSLGMIGYSVVNVGSVGGVIDEKFNRQLYIRWLELSIFMPVLQFNSPAGSETNDIEIIKLNKRLLKIRNDIVLPVLLKGLEESRDSGLAIIRPLFFIEDNPEPETYLITDQFAVCEDIVVAPVLLEGATQRDIYLPRGWWRDEILSQQVMGGKWLRNYTVTLDRVPYFTRVAV